MDLSTHTSVLPTRACYPKREGLKSSPLNPSRRLSILDDCMQMILDIGEDPIRDRAQDWPGWQKDELRATQPIRHLAKDVANLRSENGQDRNDNDSDQDED